VCAAASAPGGAQRSQSIAAAAAEKRAIATSSGRQRHICRAASGAGDKPPGGDPQQPPTPQSWDRLPDPWEAPGSSSGAPGGIPPPPPPPNAGPRRPNYDKTDWAWDGGDQNWDPTEGLSPEQRAAADDDYQIYLARMRAAQDPPRDKWMTPLLDWQVGVCLCVGKGAGLGLDRGRLFRETHAGFDPAPAAPLIHTTAPLLTPTPPQPRHQTKTTQSIAGAFDLDQVRTEDSMTDEALTNKAESREAVTFVARLIVIPIVAGALVGRALADPILSFTLGNNPEAFAMTGRQKIEGAQHVHEEEAKVRMLMAIGQVPSLNEREVIQHLREYAHEVGSLGGGLGRVVVGMERVIWGC